MSRMPNAVELKILPALRSCPGIPACDLVETICEDHRDVLKAIREAVEWGMYRQRRDDDHKAAWKDM